jgi:hypothetical protein
MGSEPVAVDDLRPPFTHELAVAKVQAIEDVFNCRDPEKGEARRSGPVPPGTGAQALERSKCLKLRQSPAIPPRLDR